MSRLSRLTVLPLVALLTGATAANAEPLLQLGIVGGHYDSTTETVVSDGPAFQLVALLTPQNNTSSSQLAALLADTYYISAAITPATGPVDPVGGIGSFSFNGTTVSATSGMEFGTPPSDLVNSNPDSELGSHSIYPTFYSEFAFNFSAGQRTTTYNVADAPGTNPLLNPTGGSYFALFNVDVSGLDEGYQLHFDLYDSIIKRAASCRTRQGVETCTPEDIGVGNFAPFSHDAESGDSAPVPEPATLALTLSGLGVAALRRRRAPKESL